MDLDRVGAVFLLSLERLVGDPLLGESGKEPPNSTPNQKSRVPVSPETLTGPHAFGGVVWQRTLLGQLRGGGVVIDQILSQVLLPPATSASKIAQARTTIPRNAAGISHIPRGGKFILR